MIAVEAQPQADKDLVQEILRILNVWEPYHKTWMKKANHFYALYRNYQDFKNAYNSSTSPRGRDFLISDAESEFGPELFIPMCFSTVETVLPAMLSNAPLMAVLPRSQTSEVNVPNMQGLLEAQQEQIDYGLRLQTIGKDGLITGTGVQKTFWRTDYRVRPQLVQDPRSGMMVPQQVLQMLFDDPDAAAVDPFDFIADPFCDVIQNADGAFHRTWRSTRYCKRMVDTKRWRNLEDAGGETIRNLANSDKYSEVWNQRRMIGDRGVQSGGSSMGKEDVHEVLEFHDGDRVVTILDRAVAVASGQNPSWHGELPFQVYSPTEIPHELHGIGEIEPIEQLQEELNTLRTQRRYNADLVLQRTFAYHEGMVEKEDIQFGPGYAIGVNGPPQEMLFPIQVGDIPNSGYQEEAAIGADIDRTSGISDVIAGAGLAGADTATGVQLVQSAASRRIEMKTRRLEKQVVAPGAQQFVELNQQKIITNRSVRIPAQPTPEQPDRRWSWLQLSPQELAGDFAVRPVENSMQPPNIPQERADAQMLITFFGEKAGVEQQKVLTLALEKMGIEGAQARSMLSPPNPMVPAEVLNRLVDMGVPEQAIAEALAQAGGPNLLGDAEPNPAAAAGPGAEPPSEGGPPVNRPPELEEGREPEPAAGR